jgi:hypothetical protein
MIKVHEGVGRKPVAMFARDDDAIEWARAQSRGCSITYTVKRGVKVQRRFFRGEDVPEDK